MTPVAAPLHALNNILARIIASAEFGLEADTNPAARAELERIVLLVEEAADVVAAISDQLPRDKAAECA